MRTRTRSAQLTIIFILALVLAACSAGEPTTESDEGGGGETTAETTSDSGDETEEGEILIGVVRDETGGASVYSIPAYEAAQVALEEINEAGGVGGRQLRFEAVNDESDPNLSTTRLRRLIDDHDPVAVMSMSASGTAIQSQQVAEELNVPNINPININDNLTEGDLSTFFRSSGKDSELIAVLLDSLSEQVESIALLGDNTGTGVAQGDTYVEVLEDNGVSIATREIVDPNVTDLTQTVQKMRDSEPDAVLIQGGGSVQVLSLFYKTKEALEWDIPVYGSPIMGVPAIRDLAGPGVIGTIYVDVVDDTNEKFASFAETMQEVNGDDWRPQFSEVGAYDAVYILAEALRQALDATGGLEADAIIDALENMEYCGAMGRAGTCHEFSEDRRTSLGPDSALLRIHNETWTENFQP